MSLTITNQLLIDEGKKYGITHKVVSEDHNLILLCFEGKEVMVRRARIPNSSGVCNWIADYKGATYHVLEYYDFAIPQSKTIHSFEKAAKFAEKIKYPVVVKPEKGGWGQGVTTNIKNKEELKKAFKEAQKFNEHEIIIQKFIPGNDYRILMVDFKTVAIAKRIPAQVFGDNKLTVNELIEKENQNPLRAKGHHTPLSVIKIDSEVKRVLIDQNLTLESIPEKGQKVQLRKNANLSTGGEAEDVTDLVPQENIKLFEDMTRALNANVIGIDVRCEDIAQILTKDNYAVIEVNASPGIRMHHFPSKGKPRNVALKILQVLFPNAFKNHA